MLVLRALLELGSVDRSIVLLTGDGFSVMKSAFATVGARFARPSLKSKAKKK